jgi:subtilase family serine protease
MEHMMLQLQRSPEREKELRQYIDELETPGSPNYHKWLTAQEFGERYGLAQRDLDTITGWLTGHGLTVNIVYTNRVLIDFSGTAGQVHEAFQTEIHTLDVDGVKHYANMSDPKVPAALAPAVVGVVSLHNFTPHTQYKMRSQYTVASNEQLVVPADLAKIYNVSPLFTAGTSGQGQTIVVIEDTNVYSTTDWTTFRSTFGLSTYTSGSFTQVHPAPPSGTNNCTNPGVLTNGADGEAILDAEYSSAAAPNAAIELASCADASTFGGLIALQNLLNESATPPAIVSISYGECEAINGAAANATYSTAYQQGVTEGVSVFVSSGDQSAASCDANDNVGTAATHGIGVSGFTSTIYNVSVGGTDFGDAYAGTTTTYWGSNSTTYGSALSYIPEIPWDDSCASVLISTYYSGSGTTYGTSGFCNSTLGEDDFLGFGGGSGGPSGCATGSATTSGVVSGTCAGYAKPSWQSLVGVPADSVRDIPDVSLFAANGVWGHAYAFCDSNPGVGLGGEPCTGAPSGWSLAGGTSFASPIWAGFQALINQKAGDRQGNPNPTYYSLAKTEYGASGSTTCNSTLGNGIGTSCVFYDVTQGDMDVDCTGTNNCYRPSGTYGVLSTSDSSYAKAYGTTTGWDFATGIGTVNVTNLANAWPASTTPNFSLSAAPSSVTIAQGGTGGTSTITIIPTDSFTGSVTLTASGLPTGVTAAFGTNPATATSVLTLTASGTATTGTVTVTITGVSGSLTHTTTISLTVTPPPNFTLSASEAKVEVFRMFHASVTITVTPVNGFNGSVSLAATGVPAGAVAAFVTNPATSTSTMTFTEEGAPTSGTFPVTVTGTSGSLTHSVTFNVVLHW